MRALGLLIIFLFATVAASAADSRPNLLRDARKCAAACQREDLPTIAAYAAPRIVQRAGGRAAFVRELKEQFDEARRWGAEQFEVSIGAPPMPRSLGKWMFSVVPVTAVVHGAHVVLTQETHVLALSFDQGKRWSFVPLYDTTQEELIAQFPELRGKVIVPETSRPRVSLGY